MDWWLVFDDVIFTRISIGTELWNLDCLAIVAIFLRFTNWKWCNFSLHEILQQVILIYSRIWIATGLWHYIVSHLFKCFHDSDIARTIEWLLAFDIICRLILIAVSIAQLIINFKLYKLNLLWQLLEKSNLKCDTCVLFVMMTWWLIWFIGNHNFTN